MTTIIVNDHPDHHDHPALPGIALRAAVPEDIEAIATLWYHGWQDGHLGHVPAELRQHRRLVDLLRLVPGRLEGTTVSTAGSSLIGFVTVHDDEVEQLYVAEGARGSGVAAALLRNAELVIAAHSEWAWLAVVAGNARARRFYARQGWSDSCAIDYVAQTPTGTFRVPARRYEKRVAGEIAGPAEIAR